MKHVTSIGYRRPRESGGPEQPFEPCGPWVPAFAGMTDKTVDFAEIIVVRALNDIHPQNQGKAKFFMLFGFMLANWQELRKAPLDHPHNNAVVNQTTFQYGEIYEIGCSIASPDGRNPCVRSLWAIEPRSTDPKFITAYAGLLKAAEGREPDHFSSGELR